MHIFNKMYMPKNRGIYIYTLVPVFTIYVQIHTCMCMCIYRHTYMFVFQNK